jgi:hypothetical protein
MVAAAWLSSACHTESSPRADVQPPASVAPPAASSAGGRLAANADPHHGTRPPKPKAVATATTPNLPTLAAQAAALPEKAKPPTKGADEFPCGSVWTGEQEVAVECDDLTDEKTVASPATPLIPFALLHVQKSDLPANVDHRVDGFEGRVLSQGHSPACTAFSFTSQVNHAIGLWTGQPGDVSAMQVWARYHRPSGGSCAAANLGKSFAKDADWPFDQVAANGWSKCKGGDCLQPSDQAKLDELEKKGVAVLEEIEKLPADATLLDTIAAKLAGGCDVGVGGKLPPSFKAIGEAGSRYVPDFTVPGKGGHAFLTVGYTHVGSERYFLIKNSWGEGWGDKGYAWIHEQTLEKISHNGATVLIVEPVGDVGLRRYRRKKELVAACGTGEAPDSADGTCMPLCPDGGAEHSGYCGVTEDCTKGFVNISGECVLAAPTAKSTEPKTGIAFTCTPTGCLYTIPKGIEACTAATCQKSCPAPDFRLGKGKGGVLCIE